MKTNSITRITALTMALAVICGGAASCGNKAGSGTSTAAGLIQNAFKAEPVGSDMSFSYVSGLVYSPVSNKVYVAGVQDSENSSGQQLFVTDLEFAQFDELPMDEGGFADGGYSIAAAPDGGLYVIQQINDFGDMELPDPDDPDFDPSSYDYGALEEARVTSYKFIRFDQEGNKVTSADIDGIDEYIENNAYFSGMYNFGKDQLLLSFSGEDEKSIAIDTEGKVIGEAYMDGLSWVSGGAETPDGETVISGFSSKGLKLKYFDTDSLKPSGKEIEIKDNSIMNISSLCNGSGEYEVFADTDKSLYGVKADGTLDEMINWTNSDMNSDYGRLVLPLENNEFIVFDANDKCFSRMTKRDSSDFENTKVITLGMGFDDGTISQKVKEFNKSHDDVRIKTVDYQKYNSYDEESMEMTDSAEKHMKMDIVSGNAPDMVVTYGTSLQLSLAGKGVFADMGELLDADSELSRDDILPNVLEACKINGKLLSLPSNFTVSSLAVKKKFFDKENWTFADLKETYEKMPEGTELTEITTRSNAFYILKDSLSSCIDYEKGTCNFDTEQFRDILEFCSQFKDDSELMDWYNSSSDEEINSFIEDSQSRYKDEKALVYEMYLDGFEAYQIAKQAMFDDDITLVGVPTEDGKGSKLVFSKTYSILDSSSSKQECWEFVKSFFGEEKGGDIEAYGFPTLKSGFDKKAEQAAKPRTYTDEDGEEHEIDNTYYLGGKEIKIDPLSDKDRDYIVDYIMNTDTAEFTFTDEVNEIVTDCITAYFKKEKSADETIELINSKVSILLSEQS